MPAADQVTQVDLDAYVDDQLDLWQRARVEQWLAARPDAAARVMADLRIRDELRLATAVPAGENRRTGRAAGKLARGIARDRNLRRALRLLPACALIVVGWVAHTGIRPLSASVPPPAVVEAALAARDAGNLRLSMPSQPPFQHMDREGIRAATGIILPLYDSGWTLRDAQIFPSPQGPGVEITFDTEDMGRLHVFAARPGGFAVTLPASEQRGGIAIVWFQIGETAHVLLAETDTERLRVAAERLSRTLY
ncbi:transmembrane anti-sigma factor [Haematobacter missouriensis]|uniref:Anti-sigma factor n=1 Tax=Haematobacter missouriensis TaxID=366616 RepID=A0A212AMN4_9RHOB|nr:hypothetical protein [Haematobacter missouriensis]KFI24733.1 transmembrane anti-sigma factor [Haematobacter missouriensis]OWJ75056.1 anti-sigma factor [Haematobacter missouriensis]OWJ82761.1 anti-sigma factor [Haematobacter missouriensis]